MDVTTMDLSQLDESQAALVRAATPVMARTPPSISVTEHTVPGGETSDTGGQVTASQGRGPSQKRPPVAR